MHQKGLQIRNPLFPEELVMTHNRGFAFLVCAFTLILSPSLVAQQSLGDAARKAEQNKPARQPKKVITNDDISAPAPPPASTDPDSASAGQQGDQPAKPAQKAAGDAAAKPAESSNAADQDKLDADWKKKIDAQKQEIAQLERELDVLQRENKLRAATFYADAGNRLRDEKKYAEEDRKYQADIATKQKAIDDAKAKLDAMKDEARQAGASPSVRN
jgi:hypothetical protein